MSSASFVKNAYEESVTADEDRDIADDDNSRTTLKT